MNPLRKFVQIFGLDIHKYRPTPDKLSFVKNLEIKTVLDIGANVGQFAKEIREVLPNAQIYSFEPLKECFQKLGVSMQQDTKFKAFNFALGDKNGDITINKSSYTPSSSLLPMADSHKKLFPHTKDSSPENIVVKTLDDTALTLTLEPEILIKVDTQEYESRVIAGGTETFKKARAIIIESCFLELYKDQPLFADIYNTLTEMGFVYKGALHQKLNSNGQILFEDSIYTR